MLTFRLLGASFDDLMLPENYLIVEGWSDFIFMKKVIELIDQKKSEKIQILYVQGIQNAPFSVNAIAEMIRPYYAEDSLYRDRIVCIIDEPKNTAENKSASKIDARLNISGNQRFFKMGKDKNGINLDLEKTIPEGIYIKASRIKSDVLNEISSFKKDFSGLGKYKEMLANDLTMVLTIEDLDLAGMETIKAAAEKVLQFVS